jgi:heme oxygenase
MGTAAHLTDIMSRLRDETADLHKQAEAQPIEQDLVKGSLPLEGLIAFLGQRLHIHQALEAAAGRLVAADDRFAKLGLQNLQQVPNIESDLRELGAGSLRARASKAARKVIDRIGQIEREQRVALMGVYYVFEGSKNGARFIARGLCKTLGLNPRQVRYFDPHGDDQRCLWGEFKDAMGAIRLTDEERDAMVAAARETFSWIIRADQEVHAEQLAV